MGDITRSDADLKLAADSPFRDPDIIYLEADVLTNDEETGLLTASGEVEGRYQDRTLRAEKVIYNLNTGNVFAEGNVILIQADGSSQYAEKLELSNALEAGTATDFTARMANGAVTGAKFVARGKDGEIELYNAYYTACETCAEKPNPSWRLKARRVTQDKSSRTVQYRDATLELFGLPVFYTPYLAHPDPSADRASGFLTPFVGLSDSKGFNTRTPYYWAIDDYTEATFTPRIFTKVNPLMEYQFARKFATGRIDVEGSFTNASVFDRDGDPFDDASLFTNPGSAPIGKRWRSHIFARGLFAPTDFWSYGFGLQLATDDNYLTRYDLSTQRRTQGLYEGESRRNTSQAFLIGQDEDTRFTVSTVGFQNLRDRIIDNGDGTFTVTTQDDGRLPILAPRIQAEHYMSDPLINGRLKFAGDFTALTREKGDNYMRAVGSIDYTKTWIAPGGVEVKPFANGRFDAFDLESRDIGDDDLVGTSKFTRTLGQAGVDIRYPFLKADGDVTWLLEPRVQVTQSFGDAKLDEFRTTVDGTPVNFSEDSGNADLDSALLWQANKASGFDFWQEGLRADVGGRARAEWGKESYSEVFVGQSFAANTDGQIVENISGENGSYLIGSGLEGDQSDIVGEFRLKLGKNISSRTRARYDESTNTVTRLDSTFGFSSKWLSGRARYYKLNGASRQLILNTSELDDDDISAPPEEISGSVKLRISDNWSTRYTAFRDIDRGVTRRESLGLTYRDDCTLIEVLYSKRRFNSDAIRDSSGISVRFALLTLGDTGRQK